MTTALILAGHGSHISADTAGLVWGYVDQLRAWGVADEITACFWKELPSFRDVLRGITADQIVIVPVFTAQGYFSQTIIPAEMGLTGDITGRDGQTIHYTRTLGEHPALGDIVRERVNAALTEHNLNPADVAVAVIGHGTPRSSASRDAAREQADALRQAELVGEVVAVYLDDDPDIPSIYDTTSAAHIIAVPYFLAYGSHVMQDVPAALGIEPVHTPQNVNNRTVIYTPPVGTADAICRVIIELARDSGLAFNRHPVSDEWAGMPQGGADVLAQLVQQRGELIIGQLRVTADFVEAVAGGGQAVTSPAQLRDLTRRDPFRPLATSDDLPEGWQVAITSPEQAAAVIETVYPGCLIDWARAQVDFPVAVTRLDDLISEQQAIGRNIHMPDAETIEATLTTVCGRCTRDPIWHTSHRMPAKGLPCPSPCNVWLSAIGS